MIISNKIKQIRKYLSSERRVFINNIIITLPSRTKLLDENQNTVDARTITTTQPVEIQIPNEFNVIGLVDGQHRVFAYHEGGENDEKIKILREKQNLLVTGIIYPSKISDFEKTKFEARLFLEINSNQSNAKSDLKQAIGLILKPFSAESVSRAVLENLNKSGSLEKLFEVNIFDKGKIKTTSIVSYGLRPLLKLSGQDSLFSLWKNIKKDEIKNETDNALLEEYITFSCSQINLFLGAVRYNLIDVWAITNTKNLKNILNTTTINGLLICLRKLIEKKKTGNFEYYKTHLAKISSTKILTYKSSQYGDLGDYLFSHFS
jgi:DGQHR domain-containing protein